MENKWVGKKGRGSSLPALSFTSRLVKISSVCHPPCTAVAMTTGRWNQMVSVTIILGPPQKYWGPTSFKWRGYLVTQFWPVFCLFLVGGSIFLASSFRGFLELLPKPTVFDFFWRREQKTLRPQFVWQFGAGSVKDSAFPLLALALRSSTCALRRAQRMIPQSSSGPWKRQTLWSCSCHPQTRWRRSRRPSTQRSVLREPKWTLACEPEPWLIAVCVRLCAAVFVLKAIVFFCGLVFGSWGRWAAAPFLYGAWHPCGWKLRWLEVQVCLPGVPHKPWSCRISLSVCVDSALLEI